MMVTVNGPPVCGVKKSIMHHGGTENTEKTLHSILLSDLRASVVKIESRRYDVNRYSGEWRNGRRWGLKIPCPNGRMGSTPISASFFVVRRSYFVVRITVYDVRAAENEVM